MVVRRLSFFALLGACGLDTTGTAGEVPGAAHGDAGADVSIAGDAGRSGDGAATPPDAGPDAPPPDPAKVSVSYAAGKDKKVYRFDMDTQSFTALPSAGCPAAEETAVRSDGTIFVTSSNNEDLFRVTPTGCTPVKTRSTFPYAFGTAPIGTVSATEETLVGYSGADYVRVDPNTGDVTTITAGALGTLRPSGDLTAVGTRGFLAAASGVGSCPANGDCIVEVSLRSGLPVSAPVQVPGFGIYGLAHSHGLLLLFANQQVFPYDFGSRTLGGSLAAMPGGANFTGAGAPPYPSQ
jgi:hypothetical protein